ERAREKRQVAEAVDVRLSDFGFLGARYRPGFLPASRKQVLDGIALSFNLRLAGLRTIVIFGSFEHHAKPASRVPRVGGLRGQRLTHLLVARPIRASNVQPSEVA